MSTSDPKPELDLEFEAVLLTPEGQEYLRCETAWLEAKINRETTYGRWRQIGGYEAETKLMRRFGYSTKAVAEFSNYLLDTRLKDLRDAAHL